MKRKRGKSSKRPIIEITINKVKKGKRRGKKIKMPKKKPQETKLYKYLTAR